mgnify:CR=1 FL=1
MNYPLFIAACLMVYWPTLVLWGVSVNYNYNRLLEPSLRGPIMTFKGYLWHGVIAVALTIITLGVVLAFRSFV